MTTAEALAVVREALRFAPITFSPRNPGISRQAEALDALALIEQRISELEAALRLIANPDGVVRAGDPSAMRIPPHDIARRALGGGE